MVTYWAHNGLLRARVPPAKSAAGPSAKPASPLQRRCRDEAVSGKMSRSKGAGGLADLIERQGGERIRFFLLRTHYRSTVLFNEPAIEEAGIGLESFYRLFKRYERITGKSFYDLKFPTTREAGETRRRARVNCSARWPRFARSSSPRWTTTSTRAVRSANCSSWLRSLNRYCDDP